MTHREAPLSLKEIARFALDLEEGAKVTGKTDEKRRYLIDANVVWFYQQLDGQSEKRASGQVALAIGLRNIAGLIRHSLSDLSESDSGLFMLEPHKLEVDITSSQIQVPDYNGLQSLLDRILSDGEKKGKNTEYLARHLIEIMRTEAHEYYDLLADIFSGGPVRRNRIASQIRTFKVARGTEVTDELRRTLLKLRFLLKDDVRRPALSIGQDIKAIRDLALYNASGGGHTATLLTFDKRLIEAVRTIRALREPWSEFISVQNCQTFWIWNTFDEGAHSKKAAESVMTALDDFRVKARQIFGPVESAGANPSTALEAWFVGDQRVLEYCQQYSARRDLQSKLEKADLETADEVIQLFDRLDSSRSSRYENYEPLQNACNAFFREVNGIIPVLQFLMYGEHDEDKIVQKNFASRGYSRVEFLSSLSNKIQEHARDSMVIMGAGSLLAPRTLGAIGKYIRSLDGPEHTRFVHRLPVPIQSDDFDLDEVVKLLSDANSDAEARYDKLMELGTLKGPVADLVISYIYANCGEWAQAEHVLSESLGKFPRSRVVSSAQYEMNLLLAAVLRIFQTSEARLKEADQLLRRALSSTCKRPRGDIADFRIRVEAVAIQVNSVLLRLFWQSHSKHKEKISGDVLPDVGALASELIALKAELAYRRDIDKRVSGKLIANINTNYILACYYVPRMFEHTYKDDAFLKDIVEEGYDRLTGSLSRVSYFEEIIVGFAVIVERYNDKSTHPGMKAIVERVRSRLSRILQRRYHTNEFEVWLCSGIKQKLEERGYYL